MIGAMASDNATAVTAPYNNASGLNETESVEDLNARYFQSLIPVAVFYAVVSLVGILGNTLVLIVVPCCKEYKSNTMRVFVVCFGILDLLICVTLIPAELWKFQTYFFRQRLICKMNCFAKTFSTSSAALMFLIIGIDRYRKVCQTFKRQISTRLALRLVIAVNIVALVLSIPSPILCGVTITTKENVYGTKTVVQVCGAEQHFQRSIFRMIYKWTLSGLLLLLSITFIFLYSCIGKKIVRHVSLRKGGNTSISFDSSGKFSGHKDSINPKSSIDDGAFFADSDGAESAFEKSDRKQSNGGHDLTDRCLNGCHNDNTGRDKPRLSSQSSSASKKQLPQKQRHRLFSRSLSVFSTLSQRRQSNSVAVPNKTLIWLILTALFIATYIIHAGLTFVNSVFQLRPLLFSIYMLFNNLFLTNHVLNPFVYASLDKRFRHACVRLFSKCKRRLRRGCNSSMDQDFQHSESDMHLSS